MLKLIISWTLGLAVLVGGAWAVCPDGQCALADFDRSGLELFHALRSPLLDRLMLGITWLGSLVLLLPLAGLGAWRLLHVGRSRAAGFVMLAVLGASALSHLVKLWVARPRPDLFPPLLTMSDSWSYPSAHAMQVTAAALALFLVARRRAWAVPLVISVLLVDMSRIYLQVHFPSDVIVGVLAAGFWVGGLYALFFRRPVGHKTGRARGGAA